MQKMEEIVNNPSWRSLLSKVVRIMGWNRSSYVILGVFLLTIIMIIYVWWPLAEMVISYVDWSGDWWRYFDWLLVGIFLFMTLMIMAGADLRRDVWILLVGAAGGLVIEAWGTQTYLWTYFTDQRPPLWIIPAWPIASLTIDRMVRLSGRILPDARNDRNDYLKVIYWILFTIFTVLMLLFTWPFMNHSMTLMAVLLVAFIISTPIDYRTEILLFLAGSFLGIFLEYWGTTRECWTYYTRQTPPLFAVLAHGMAAVVFWRSIQVVRMFSQKMVYTLLKWNGKSLKKVKRFISNNPD